MVQALPIWIATVYVDMYGHLPNYRSMNKFGWKLSRSPLFDSGSRIKRFHHGAPPPTDWTSSHHSSPKPVFLEVRERSFLDFFLKGKVQVWALFSIIPISGKNTRALNHLTSFHPSLLQLNSGGSMTSVHTYNYPETWVTKNERSNF